MSRAATAGSQGVQGFLRDPARALRRFSTLLLIAIAGGMALSSVGVFRVLADAIAGYGYEGTCGRLDRDGVKTIDGNPLNVCIDGFGTTQGRFDTDAEGTLSFASLSLLFPGLQTDDSYVEYEPVAQEPTTGTDAKTQVTRYRAIVVTSTATGQRSDPVADVTQVSTYAEGTDRFTSTYTVKNVTTATLRMRAIAYGGLDLDGGLGAQGQLTGAQPDRRLRSEDPAALRLGGIDEVGPTPWSHYQIAGRSRSFFNALRDPDAAGFDDTVGGPETAPFMGVQWDDQYMTGLAPGAEVTYAARWQLRQSPAVRSRPYFVREALGATARTDFVYFDPRGSAGKLVRYAITGDNPQSGTVRTDAGGSAPVSWALTNGPPAVAPGERPRSGFDEVRIHVDLDEDGVEDPGERIAYSFRSIGGTQTTTPPTTTTSPPAVTPPPVTRPVVPPAARPTFAQLNASLNASLGPLVGRFGGIGSKTIRRRKFVAHPFAFLESGRVEFRWVVSRKAVRRAGVKASQKGTKSTTLTIAKGASVGTAGQTAQVPVRLTRTGKALLRKARSVRITLAATFTGGQATAAKPAAAESRFTLKRAVKRKK